MFITKCILIGIFILYLCSLITNINYKSLVSQPSPPISWLENFGAISTPDIKHLLILIFPQFLFSDLEIMASIETLPKTYDDSDELYCKACRKLTASVIILPCGHMSCCEKCIGSLSSCLTCKGCIAGTVKALFATATD